MKKIFTIILSLLFVNVVYAFDIDIDKIDINSRSKTLTSDLDKSYKIDTGDFSHLIVNDENAIKLVKSLINISASNKDLDTKKQEYTTHMYTDPTDGAKTLAGTIFRDTYFNELKKYKIEGGYVSDVKTVPFRDDVLAFAYIKDAKVNEKDNEIVLTYWLKKDRGEYKVYYPWITIDTKLEDFFRKIADDEDEGDFIGTAYNSLSLATGESIFVPDDELKDLYLKNVKKVVQITGMDQNGLNMYGSGFFLRDGVIVTTWSLFQQFLTNSNYIFVNDEAGNTYKITGIVAAQEDYDAIVLKLDKQVGTKVEFAKSSDLKLDDKLFMINSRNNGGFSINYGTFVSLDKGRLKNLLAISSGDVGSALFTRDGKVVGFNVSDQVNSELSYANSTDYLVSLQELLLKQDYKDIKATDIEVFKNSYYLHLNEEKEYNNVSSKIWDKYKTIGNLENNISLSLIKASYSDRILSLRYKANSYGTLDSMYMAASFMEELEKEGFSLVQDNEAKKVYENNDYKVVIKENFSYLIVLIVEK